MSPGNYQLPMHLAGSQPHGVCCLGAPTHEAKWDQYTCRSAPKEPKLSVHGGTKSLPQHSGLTARPCRHRESGEESRDRRVLNQRMLGHRKKIHMCSLASLHKENFRNKIHPLESGRSKRKIQDHKSLNFTAFRSTKIGRRIATCLTPWRRLPPATTPPGPRLLPWKAPNPSPRAWDRALAG